MAQQPLELGGTAKADYIVHVCQQLGGICEPRTVLKFMQAPVITELDCQISVVETGIKQVSM